QRVTDDTAPLTLGARVDGTIAHTGQSDRYTFSLAADTRLYFDTFTDVDFQWSLTGPRGALVTSASMRFIDGPDGNPFISAIAGAYTLTVNGPDDRIGNYSFRVLDLGAATPFTPGTAVSGSLS